MLTFFSKWHYHSDFLFQIQNKSPHPLQIFLSPSPSFILHRKKNFNNLVYRENNQTDQATIIFF